MIQRVNFRQARLPRKPRASGDDPVDPVLAPDKVK